jgi:hypothetical protein
LRRSKNPMNAVLITLRLAKGVSQTSGVPFERNLAWLPLKAHKSPVSSSSCPAFLSGCHYCCMSIEEAPNWRDFGAEGDCGRYLWQDVFHNTLYRIPIRVLYCLPSLFTAPLWYVINYLRHPWKRNFKASSKVNFIEGQYDCTSEFPDTFKRKSPTSNWRSSLEQGRGRYCVTDELTTRQMTVTSIWGVCFHFVNTSSNLYFRASKHSER